MKARFEFTLDRACKKCGRTGAASLSQADGLSYARGDRATRVEYLSDGFKVVAQPSYFAEIAFFCATDNQVAVARGRSRRTNGFGDMGRS